MNNTYCQRFTIIYKFDIIINTLLAELNRYLVLLITLFKVQCEGFSGTKC